MNPNPKRSIFDLTPAECQTIFVLAFGYAPPLEHLQIVPLAALSLIGPAHSIILYASGGVYVSGRTDEGEYATYFNAAKVVSYLREMNIEFGETSAPTDQHGA